MNLRLIWAKSWPAFLIMLAGTPFGLGLNGPYVFDDYSNLISNVFVKVDSLAFDSLFQAAYSLSAGPLQRPVSMLSFAVNYYFVGAFTPPLAFKSVNLLIHVTNGVLIFILARIVLARLAERDPTRYQKFSIRTVALIIALFWITHPLQITSVLYLVQRMTALSALFTLLGLLSYLRARAQINNHNRAKGASFLTAAFLLCWPLALLSKENALLFPLFVLLIDLLLYSDRWPWNLWHGSTRLTKIAVIVFLISTGVAFLAFSIQYAAPGYAQRTFTMGERLLTEPRVLLFYLGLIFVPRINEFGVFHDDIELSQSLFIPWTTLPAVLAISALLVTAFLARTRFPLLSLGIAWFFVAHLLESTIFALEIAHEHRNYVALLGPACVLAEGMLALSARFKPGAVLSMAMSIVVIFSAITTFRAWQWGAPERLFYYDALHHPKSPAASAAYANLLLAQGKYEESVEMMYRASELQPREAAFLISLQTTAVVRGNPLKSEDNEEIKRRLSRGPISALTEWSLSNASDCVLDRCAALQVPMDDWMKLVITKHEDTAPPGKRSTFYYFLARALYGQGKINEAIQAYAKSYEYDTNYYHPLFDLATLYLSLGEIEAAKVIAEELQRVNQRSVHKREKDIEELIQLIQSTEDSQKKRRR